MSSLNLDIPLNDNNTIPWLAFGTGTALNGRDAEELVALAISNGILHLDGAQSYRNEESLGAGLAVSGKPRSSLFVTTKLGKIPAGQTLDYVDLFLVHSPKNHEGELNSVWKQVEELQKEGLAKSIGVSNFRVQDFEEISKGASVVPAVNQIEYHPYVLKADQPVIEYMKKQNILPTSFGGLSPITRVKDGQLDPVLKPIRARVELTARETATDGQVLQLWLRAKGIPAITTSTKEERIKEYWAVQTLPRLTTEEVDAIDEAGSKAHHRFFSTWWDD
ncbi:Aldo/keto reductase [Sparassis latifolia]